MRSWAVICGIALAGAGCRDDHGRLSHPARAAKTGFVAVVGVSETDSAWSQIRAAAERHADDFRPLRVRTAAPRVRSPNAQIQLLTRLQREGVRGVCVQVDDPEALAPVLEALRSAGIVVVTMGLPVRGHTPFFHSGVIPRNAGVLLADLAAEAIDGRGTLVVVVPEGEDFFDACHDGFQRQIATHPQIQVLPAIVCPRETSKAQRLIDACAERFPRLDAWVLLDTRLLEPDAGTVLNLPLNGRCVTLGMTPVIQAKLAERSCAATLVADDDAMVSKALELCAMTARGFMVGFQSYEVPIRAVRNREEPVATGEERAAAAEHAHTQPDR
jgi:hypothetical protein